jgi:hypothetical protein
MQSNFPEAKFITPKFEVQNSQYQPSLIILDQDWWAANEYIIYEWMAERLPRGIHHHYGITLNFEHEQDRLMFLMRWS